MVVSWHFAESGDISCIEHFRSYAHFLRPFLRNDRAETYNIQLYVYQHAVPYRPVIRHDSDVSFERLCFIGSFDILGYGIC